MSCQLRPRILCIDDDELFCELLQQYFTHTGEFLVESESDPFQAINKMRAFKPDVVLLDVNMPGQSGFQIAQDMRKEPWLRHRPIVFYSGMHGAEAAMLRAGVGQPTEFVQKGVPLAVVEEAVRRLIAERLLLDRVSKGVIDRSEAGEPPLNAMSICRETRITSR